MLYPTPESVWALKLNQKINVRLFIFVCKPHHISDCQHEETLDEKWDYDERAGELQFTGCAPS